MDYAASSLAPSLQLIVSIETHQSPLLGSPTIRLARSQSFPRRVISSYDLALRNGLCFLPGYVNSLFHSR